MTPRIKLVEDTITQEYVEGAGLIYDPDTGEAIGQERVRVMSPFEIKQRLELNVANTTEALRAKVIAEHNAKSNGHGTNAGYPSTDRPLDERCQAIHWHSGRCVLGINHTDKHLAADEFQWR